MMKRLHLFRFFIKEQNTVFFDLNKNPFTRHLYALVVFFRIKGFTVYVKPNFNFMYDCFQDRYTRSMFENSEVFFSCNPSKFKVKFGLDGKDYIKLNANYYSPSKLDDRQSYFIPLSMHPLIYKRILKNTESNITIMRNNAVFFAGNLSSSYNIDSNKKYFDVENRISLIHAISPQLKQLPQNKATLQEIRRSKSVVIIDTNAFYLTQDEYLKQLQKFDFFLACPGIVKPTAHNIIEAIFSGCIPIIQRSYAIQLKPPLRDGVNALFFNHLDDVNHVIEKAFGLEDERKDYMRKEIEIYYKNFLSPSAVVNQILSNAYEDVFLEAEYVSIELLKLEKETYAKEVP